MMRKVARRGLLLFLALLIAVSVPLLAENQTNKDANSKTSDSREKKSKDKDKAKNKKKNSDVENIGNRNINKGNINFISLDKEIAMGRQLAADFIRIRRPKCGPPEGQLSPSHVDRQSMYVG
jgi:hypothetical protein